MPLVTVLIVKAGPLAADSLRQHVFPVYPNANCISTTRIEAARAIVRANSIDLILSGVSFADGDVFDLLLSDELKTSRPKWTLIVTGRGAPRLLLSLRSVTVNGVFDSIGEPPENLQHAVRMIRDGHSYWSPAFAARLLGEHSRMVPHQLTPSEQLGLAIMGDGCGDQAAAERFGMERSSMRGLRKLLYSKLGVHAKEDLQRAAVQLGYTRFTSAGVTALGLRVLVLEYLRRSKRPITLPPALAAGCHLPAAASVSGEITPAPKPGKLLIYSPTFVGQSALPHTILSP